MNPEELVNRYVEWLRENISAKAISDRVVALDSPLLDRHNDYLRVYVQQQGDRYRLTDDGYVFFDLRTHGFSFTESRKEKFLTFVANHGVSFDEDTEELFVWSSEQDLPRKKHSLIQAMVNVGDMFLTNWRFVKTIFSEDVRQYFVSNNIPATPSVSISGKGYEHRVDFVVPQLNEKPEQIIKAINDPQKDKFEQYLFAVHDIRQSDGDHAESSFVFFINDQNREPKASDLSALSAYRVDYVLWSEREDKLGIFRPNA